MTTAIEHRFVDFIGYRHVPMRSISGDEVARIETPFAFYDGHPITVYAAITGERAHFFDDGETLFTLSTLGFDLTDRRRLRPLRGIASTFDVVLRDDGEFEVFSLVRHASIALARYCAAMVGIVNWARDTAEMPADESMLSEEVGLYLRAWKPKSELKQDVEIGGLSGQKHRFDFEVDGQLTDAIVPQQNASAATLRKIVDVQTASSSPTSFLVVIDDRRRPSEATQESKILSNVADTWLLSRLMSVVGSPRSAH